MLKFFKALGKLAISIVLVVTCFFAYDRYNSQSLRSFCSSLPTDSTPESVLAEAQDRKFVTHDLTERLGAVSVLNHKSPFFRYECNVSFRDRRMIGAQLRAAD